MTRRPNLFPLLLLLFFLLSGPIFPKEGYQPFVENANYNPAIPTPESVLGFKIGERAVNYKEMETYLQTLDESSQNSRLFSYGSTHEGRKLYYFAISNRKNIENLNQIREKIGALANPSSLSQAQANEIIKNYPAIAWMQYTIHGDELSGTDAALFLAYHLLASTDEEVKKLLDNLVIFIDPLQNPDGRERFVHQVQIFNGKILNDDSQSISHRGQWPWGRGNHYFFDLNRDYLALTQPEGKARAKNLAIWNPQLVVDGHEMGSDDTYLFSPPREPFNPYMEQSQFKWWKVFSQDQANAFNRYGWKYYTREWNESFFPGYGTSWPIYRGAVGILYEQAGVEGTAVKQPDGYELTYHESVHHQIVSSLANLTTAASNREAILRDFYEYKLKNSEFSDKKPVKALLIPPTSNRARLSRFVDILLEQGFEIKVAKEEFTLSKFSNYFGVSSDKKNARIYLKKKKFPKGTIILFMNQPLQPLIHNLLDFDLPMSTKFLKMERRELEKYGRSKMYEVSSWSLSLASSLDIYSTTEYPQVATSKLENLTLPGGKLLDENALYGFMFSGEDDNALYLVADLLQKDFKIREIIKPTTIEGISYPAGSFLLLKKENNQELVSELKTSAEKFHLTIRGINTGLATKGADLGGSYSRFLIKPKTAIVVGNNVSTTSSGAIWHLLDNKLRLKTSLLNVDNLNYADLFKYNVVILPPAWGNFKRYGEIIGKSGLRNLKDWVEHGGTIIAIGTAAAVLADTSNEFSKVRLRRQALKNLDDYIDLFGKEADWERPEIDSLEMWTLRPVTIHEPETSESKKTRKELKELRKEDSWKRRFSPDGVYLNGLCDTENWLTFGVGKQIPLFCSSSYVFYSKPPVSAAVRFDKAETLRLSGLLWPEARERIQKSAYLTRESYGDGQIILFANDPTFRNYQMGLERLFLNAVITGPGLGARQSSPY